jgi:hypothetical protein
MSIPTLRKLHGKTVGVSKRDQVVATGGFVAGGYQKPSIVFPSPDTTAFFEDFHGDVLKGVGNAGEVITDTGTAGPYFITRKGDTGNTAALTAATNGVFRTTMSDSVATGTPAGSVSSVVGPVLAWKANMGPANGEGHLRLGARVKFSANTLSGLFIGFTDSNAAEMPFYDTGDGQPTDTGQLHTGTVAADAVGFHFGENSDTGWRGISAKSTAGDSGDQQVTLTTTAPTANTYQVFEVVLRRGGSDTGGRAEFFIDGIGKGIINSPLATATALTPVIAAIAVNAGGETIDVDWVNVSGQRDTGF